MDARPNHPVTREHRPPRADRDVRRRVIRLDRPQAPCRRCGAAAKRHSAGKRQVHDLGVDAPAVIDVTYSKHYCPLCKKHFCIAMDHLARDASHYSERVRRKAIDLYLREGLTFDATAARLRERHHVVVGRSTLHDWITDELAPPPPILRRVQRTEGPPTGVRTGAACI